MEVVSKFWRGKRVLITGHTGFKGSWLVMLLEKLGAELFGVSLPPPTEPSIYSLCKLKDLVRSFDCDIRDLGALNRTVAEVKPEIVFHLAAQPLVGYSYKHPVETYQTNVLGTLNILEAIKFNKVVKCGIMVTTDKCYKNREWPWGYRENDELGGHDPYSSSKAAAEILIKSYTDSFFYDDDGAKIASVRAGNVIGGGDWADDRLIPDIFKSIFNNENIELRNPNAVRPWQHVLDPIAGYVTLAEQLFNGKKDLVGAWNFGPDYKETMTASQIVEAILERTQCGVKVNSREENLYAETSFLKLDSTKALSSLNWSTSWNLNTTLQKTIEWYLAYNDQSDMLEVSRNQIDSYIQKSKLFNGQYS